MQNSRNSSRAYRTSDQTRVVKIASKKPAHPPPAGYAPRVMRHPLHQWLYLATLGLVVAFTTPALAQRSASDKAAAEALFDEGLQLMKQERYDQACPKLEQSQRIDAGIGTLLYLAECYERMGRTASAWATFREAASAAQAAGQADRARQGKQRADALEPKLSRLTISVAPANRSIPDFEVTRSGTAVQAPLFDSPVPVDPGEEIVEASAPGYITFRSTVLVPGDGGTASLQIPPLNKSPEAAAPPTPESEPADSVAEPTQDEMLPPEDHGVKDGSTARTIGVVLMGAGALGIGIGGIFGMRAINKDRDADELCNNTTCWDSDGEDLNDQAQRAALVSNVAFIAGGALAVGGLVLYVTAPDGSQTARVGWTPVAGGAQLTYGGRF